MFIMKSMTFLWILLWFLGGSPAFAEDPHARIEGSHDPNTRYGEQQGSPALAALTDAQANQIIRDSCQRCHDNARVALVNSGQRVIPAIRRSARFNLEPMNLIANRAQRGRVLRAIETGGMPFADAFVVGAERINRDTFLASGSGRALMEWLRSPAP